MASNTQCYPLVGNYSDNIAKTSENAWPLPCKGYKACTGNTECQPANDTISLPVITLLDTVHIASFDLVLTANNHMLRHLARVAF